MMSSHFRLAFDATMQIRWHIEMTLNHGRETTRCFHFDNQVDFVCQFR